MAGIDDCWLVEVGFSCSDAITGIGWYWLVFGRNRCDFILLLYTYKQFLFSVVTLLSLVSNVRMSDQSGRLHLCVRVYMFICVRVVIIVELG